MADIAVLDSAIIENLRDAGCDDAFLELFARATEAGKKEILALLQKHRMVLLDGVHCGNKRIDCLDYLIHKIEKQP